MSRPRRPRAASIYQSNTMSSNRTTEVSMDAPARVLRRGRRGAELHPGRARCHVVQSALSYQIARLEREQGVTLFERTSRSVRLAPGGRGAAPPGPAACAEPIWPPPRLSPARRGDHRTAAARHDREHRAGRAAGGARPGRRSTTAIRASTSSSPTPAAARWPTRCAQATWIWRSSGSSPTRSRPTSPTGSSPTNRCVAVVPRANRTRTRGSTSPSWPARAVRRDAGRVGFRHQVDAAFARAGVARRVAFELATSDAVVRFVGLGFGVGRRAALGDSGRKGRGGW